MPIYRTLNHNFFKKWSSEMAYVLGFFAADGNMIKNKRGGHYIAFYSNDKELLVKIRTLLKSTQKIALKKKNPLYSGRPSYQIQIGSKEIYSDLLKLGLVPNKSLVLKVPAMPAKFFNHFVRGYFDGDGCVYFRKNWAKDRNKLRWVFQTRFTSGSRQFLSRLSCLLRNLEICKGGYLYDKGSSHELVFSHNDGFALFRFMYDNVPPDVYLERKYKKFQNAVKILNIGRVV